MNRIIELESVVQDNRHAGRNNGGILMNINDQSSRASLLTTLYPYV